jgi:hypothetical protein
MEIRASTREEKMRNIVVASMLFGLLIVDPVTAQQATPFGGERVVTLIRETSITALMPRSWRYQAQYLFPIS